MPTKKGWTRPDAAKLFHHFEGMYLDGSDKVVTMNVTINDSDWTVLTNTSYTDKEDGSTTVVTSGLFEEYQNTVGCLMHDTEDGTTGTVAISGRYLAPIVTSDTPAIGQIAYWAAASEKFSVTGTPGTDRVRGIFLGTAVTLAANNDRDLPAGDYAYLLLSPVQPL